MTVIEKLNNIRRRVLNGAAMLNEFRPHWDDEFAFKELDMALSNKKGFGWEEYDVLTQAELKTLDLQTLYDYGFATWKDTLILIPLWLIGFMDKTEAVVSISGRESTLAECDKDVRGGCIAFGFYVETNK